MTSGWPFASFLSVLLIAYHKGGAHPMPIENVSSIVFLGDARLLLTFAACLYCKFAMDVVMLAGLRFS